MQPATHSECVNTIAVTGITRNPHRLVPVGAVREPPTTAISHGKHMVSTREPCHNATGTASGMCKHHRHDRHDAQSAPHRFVPVGAVREPPTTAIGLGKNAACPFTAAHARSWAVHELPLRGCPSLTYGRSSRTALSGLRYTSRRQTQSVIGIGMVREPPRRPVCVTCCAVIRAALFP